MSYVFSHDSPIYLQIIDIFRDLILRGDLKPGDQLPPVREVAQQYGVNPNTVQKAFSEMDRMELTRSERTSGRYVIASSRLIDELRQERSRETVSQFIQQMKALGIACRATLEMIERGWNE